jgi:hypothetical protein
MELVAIDWLIGIFHFLRRGKTIGLPDRDVRTTPTASVISSSTTASSRTSIFDGIEEPTLNITMHEGLVFLAAFFAPAAAFLASAAAFLAVALSNFSRL